MTVVSFSIHTPHSFSLSSNISLLSTAPTAQQSLAGIRQPPPKKPKPTCQNPIPTTKFQPIPQMGISLNNSPPQSHPRTHKIFLFSNYILLGAASSCIFLTLSLRLLPSLAGFFLILLHILTIAGAISGCAASSSGSGKWYAAHMVATVLTAIFQGSVSVLIFSRTGDFLGNLKSYVREEDGVVILRLAGGLCVLIFCLEWVVLTLAFFLKYYAYVEGHCGNNGMKRSGKVQEEMMMNDMPFPYRV